MKKIMNKNSTSKKVAVPAAQGAKITTRKPQFIKQGSDGRVTVKHREYIDDITSSVSFSALTFTINPGLNGTFPWLAQIANAYETYRFKSLKFIYEPSCATTTVGTICLAVDFDPADSAPASKLQMLSYSGAVRSPYWTSCQYVCSQADLAKFQQKFVRAALLPSGTSPLLYDAGNLFIGVVDGAGATMVGELHVEYEVELLTPQLNNVGGVGNQLSITAPTNTQPFAGTVTSNNASTVLVQVLPGLDGVRFLQAGQYLINYATIWSGAPGGITTAASGGATIVTFATVVSATNNCIITCIVNVSQPGGALSFAFANAVTGSNPSVCRIAGYPAPLS